MVCFGLFWYSAYWTIQTNAHCGKSPLQRDHIVLKELQSKSSILTIGFRADMSGVNWLLAVAIWRHCFLFWLPLLHSCIAVSGWYGWTCWAFLVHHCRYVLSLFEVRYFKMPCECAGGGWCTDNREVLAIGPTLTAHQVRNKVQHQLLLIYCWFIDNVYGAAFTEQSHQDGSDMPCWVAIIFRQGRDKFRVDASQCRFVDRKSLVTFDWRVHDRQWLNLSR